MFSHVLKTWPIDHESSFPLSLIHAAMGLAGEVGELLDAIKKLAFRKNHLSDLETIKDELGDIGYYWAVLCTEFGFQPDEIMALNRDKLAGGKHGWPEAKEREPRIRFEDDDKFGPECFRGSDDESHFMSQTKARDLLGKDDE